MKKKLILDTDIGIDDAQTINFCAAVETFELMAITLVAGNANMDIISENCRRIVSLLDIEQIPIYESGSYNLQGQYIESDGYFGENALANIELPPSKMDLKTKMHAATAMVHYVNMYPGEVHIICIGPLTNLSMAFFLDNKFPSLVGSLTIMGTDTNEMTLKNVSDYAEFNAWCDPLSYTIIRDCFKAVKTPIVIVDFNICTEFLFPHSFLKQLKESSNNSNKHLDFFLRFSDKNNNYLSRNHWYTGFLCCDLTAASIFYYPQAILSKRRVSYDIVLEGDKKGHVTYRDDPNGIFELISSIDAEELSQQVVNILTAEVKIKQKDDTDQIPNNQSMENKRSKMH